MENKVNFEYTVNLIEALTIKHGQLIIFDKIYL
jgi:hypothetical protein